MKPALAGATVALLALPALFAPDPAPARDGVPLLPAFLDNLEPAVAACVLERLDAAFTESATLLLVQACTRLVYAAVPEPHAGDGKGDQLFVRCKVGGDPEWLEFRLVTRGQCAAAAGRVQD